MPIFGTNIYCGYNFCPLFYEQIMNNFFVATVYAHFFGFFAHFYFCDKWLTYAVWGHFLKNSKYYRYYRYYRRARPSLTRGGTHDIIPVKREARGAAELWKGILLWNTNRQYKRRGAGGEKFCQVLQEQQKTKWTERRAISALFLDADTGAMGTGSRSTPGARTGTRCTVLDAVFPGIL